MKDTRKVIHELLGEELTPGEMLRGLRIDAGLSQDELQEITKVQRNNISAIENNRIEMTVHYARLFAAAFKIHPGELLFPNGKFEKTEELKQIEKKAEQIKRRHLLAR